MHSIKKILSCIAGSLLLFSCSSKKKVDLLVTNAKIYTVDSSFSVMEAMAIHEGKIVATGNNQEITGSYSGSQSINAAGRFIYPGFIDAHAHFAGYASNLQTIDLTGAESWEECLRRIRDFVKQSPPAKGEWITGRGWDQNDWNIKNYPTLDSLDILFPDNPVLLTRVDGHAAIANSRALSIANVNAQTKISGGDVEVINGKPTGILIDNAISFVTSRIPSMEGEAFTRSLKQAEMNCLAKGLTTIADCGLNYPVIRKIDSLQKSGDLRLRIYAMLSDDPSNYPYVREGKYKTDRMNVRAMKVYADGALGSRGACLLHPYSDRTGYYGFLLSEKAHFDSLAVMLHSSGFQMCTHAIGDSGNRVILNTYGKILEPGNDLRWRIEHAQVFDTADLEIFGRFNIIPSVQPTHATSDMYWAAERLGDKRIGTAYAYRSLLQQNGWLPLGTDFPVEDIDPLKTFYAAVIRKDAKGWPENGFQPDQSLSRQEALKGMTIWAARSNFEEEEKGSLEAGKFADFIILDQDLMNTGENQLLGIKVVATYINGEKLFEIK